VGRRERGDRSRPAALRDQQPVRGLERRLAFVPRAAEQVFLPHVRQVAPRQAAVRRREAFQARVIFVGDGVLAGLRDDFLLNQVAPLVDRELLFYITPAGTVTKLTRISMLAEGIKSRAK